MKKIISRAGKWIAATALLLLTVQLNAQTTLKASKPINKADWVKMQDIYFNNCYGAVTLIDEQGITERLIADKPANPQDKVSWRPPPIPPTDNPDNPTGVKAKPAKTKRTISIRPKPIDPGCPTCSLFIFPGNVSKESVAKASDYLRQYN